jgi:hypothetical protein
MASRLIKGQLTLAAGRTAARPIEMERPIEHGDGHFSPNDQDRSNETRRGASKRKLKQQHTPQGGSPTRASDLP